jgi:FkbH-like protein
VDGAIAICATFTAEPVAESLQYWLNQLSIPAKVEFAPYNQVVQTLVDPTSVFARNKNGLNVVLVRFEDWERYGGNASEWTGRSRELIAALKTAASIGSSPILVCICSASAEQLEQELETELAGISTIRFLSSKRLRELYPVTDWHDAGSDQLGHIPYTPEAYAALGTAIARVFHASLRAPYKVIVTDCDNTLWRGICGESGPHGIEIDAAGRAVQMFLKSRQQAGMLLCVCSKNAPEDVDLAFDAHPEMPLARADFAGWRVNWRPKSENIQALAAEFSLGLDSFIFLDDNPMETAEVGARCPGVVALTLPATLELVPRFLDHVWAFDQNSVTAEDRKRTAMYRENALRRAVQAESLSYADFLAGLELKVDIRELRDAAEIERAAQMTQRTNQFNFTTRRFTEPEIREALYSGSLQILTAFVNDRYGDYGQVGLVMYEAVDDALHVRDFLLSCRVLGKGVEHAIVARLGEIAVAQLISAVEISFVPTPKNAPARDFLASLGMGNRVPPEMAAAARFSPAALAEPVRDSTSTLPAARPSIDFAWIATNLADPAAILKAVSDAQEVRVGASGTKPRDEMERKLTRIWERVLRVAPIGIHDDFFDLGGDSFLAVRLLSEMKPIIERDLPLITFVEAPTIAKFADLLRDHTRKRDWNHLAPLKTSGGRPPFYCVHGVGGNVLEFVDLARHVEADQPFYGIQAAGLNGTVPQKNLTIEEMAEQYIAEIREFQREGPYYLGGSSFGGWVAYEMARQLTAAGQTVGLVALFDTAVPGPLLTEGATSDWQKRFYRFSLHWHNLLVLGHRERLPYVRAKARRMVNQFGGRERLPEAVRAVNEAGRWAEARYTPAEYAGGITLFRATKQPPWIASDRTLGWAKLVKGGIQIYDTPGHHADIVRDPRVRVLARQLNDALAKAQSRCGDVSAGSVSARALGS